jgi:hypothetical protein
MNQPVVVGGTYDWFLNPASLNSETAPGVYGPWNLTGATVTISFIPPNYPSSAASHFSATAVDATNGKYHYINATSLFNAAGTWGVSWKVSLSGIVLESQIVNFTVYPSGAAQ